MLSENAEKLLKQRYYLPGENWEKLVNRVYSNNIIGDEPEYFHDIKNDIYSLKFLPNSPCLVNSGKENGGRFACFVAGPEEDTLENHFSTLSDIAEVAKRGGGCFHYDTLVYTNKGMKKIGDIVNNKLPVNVYSYNETTQQMEFKPITDYHIIDCDNIYQIDINGTTITTSNFHPFYVFDGKNIIIKTADKLNKGDLIIGSNDLLDIHNNNVDLDYWLLGYCIGDGAIAKQHNGNGYRVRITDFYESNIQRVANITSANYKKCDNKNAYEIAFYGKLAEKLYNSFDVEPRTNTKYIPYFMWEMTATQRFSLLVGLLDSDGSYNKEKQVFTYEGINERLIIEIQQLASTLGIQTRLSCKTKVRENEQPIYKLTFKKSQEITRLINKYSSKYNVICTGWTQGVFYLSESFLDNLQIKNWSKKQIINNVKFNLKRVKQEKLVTNEQAFAIIKQNNQEKLAYSVLSGSIITGINKINETQSLYDLTVDNNHNYMIDTIRNHIIVHNCGFTGTHIRYEGAKVNGSSHGYAYGPLKYAELVSKAMDMMTQSGFRKMALMFTLDCEHPNIEQFIDLKQNRSEADLYNFNQSIMVTDNFMKKAIENDTSREAALLYKIAKNAWQNGEPGVLFFDTINNNTPYKETGEIIYATNPCGL